MKASMMHMNGKAIKTDNPTITIHCPVHDKPVRPHPLKKGEPPADIAIALLEMEEGQYCLTFDFLTCPEGDLCLEAWEVRVEKDINVVKINVLVEDGEEYLDSDMSVEKAIPLVKRDDEQYRLGEELFRLGTQIFSGNISNDKLAEVTEKLQVLSASQKG